MPTPSPNLLVAVQPLWGRTGGVFRPAAPNGVTWLAHRDFRSRCDRFDLAALRRVQEHGWEGLGMHDRLTLLLVVTLAFLEAKP